MIKESLDKIIDDLSREKNKILSYYLDEYSLGSGQFQILNEIAWNEGISQKIIAQKRKIHKSAVGKSIERLIENGYIYKERKENDKRAFCLYCTEKGRQMIPVIKNIVTKVDRILTNGSTLDEIRIFKDLCLHMRKNIDKFVEDTRKQ